MLTAPTSLFLPVATADNATITFDAQVSVTVDEFGFPIFTTQPIALRARLYPASPKDQLPPGMNLPGEILRGRLNNPKTFPNTIADLATVRVVFDDGRAGTGQIKIKTQNPLAGDELGQKFTLVFKQEVVG